MDKRAKFKEEDIFFHKDKNLWLYVDAIDFIENAKEFLYTFKVLKTTNDKTDNGEWKRYYESKIVEQCVLISRKDTAKVMYGNVL